jgi:hypothetical protein
MYVHARTINNDLTVYKPTTVVPFETNVLEAYVAWQIATTDGDNQAGADLLGKQYQSALKLVQSWYNKLPISVDPRGAGIPSLDGWWTI